MPGDVRRCWRCEQFRTIDKFDGLSGTCHGCQEQCCVICGDEQAGVYVTQMVLWRAPAAVTQANGKRGKKRETMADLLNAQRRRIDGLIEEAFCSPCWREQERRAERISVALTAEPAERKPRPAKTRAGSHE